MLPPYGPEMPELGPKSPGAATPTQPSIGLAGNSMEWVLLCGSLSRTVPFARSRSHGTALDRPGITRFSLYLFGYSVSIDAGVNEKTFTPSRPVHRTSLWPQ